MYCYPVVLGIFTIWLPRFDSHGTEQSSHFSVTQKIICSWPTAAVPSYWKASIAGCTPASARWNGTADLPPAAPGQQRLNPLSKRWALRQVISDRWNQPRFSAFPMASGWWEEQRIPPGKKKKCSHCREGRAQQFGFGFISRGAVYDRAACRSAWVICPTPLSSTQQFKTHPTERQRARRAKVPASFMKSGAGRAEVTNKRSLQYCHSARTLFLLASGEPPREGHLVHPPTQHKMSMHREQEHWHCLNKHTHHVVLRGVRGFLDILIL